VTDPDSPLSFWRSVIRLRKEHQLLVYGSFELTEFPSVEKTVFAYLRRLEDQAMFVAVNFMEEDAELDLAKIPLQLGNLVIGNYGVSTSTTPLKLRSYEAVLYNFCS